MAPTPFWTEDVHVTYRGEGVGCLMFSEVDVFAENNELQERLYTLKTAVELLRDAVDSSGIDG